MGIKNDKEMKIDEAAARSGKEEAKSEVARADDGEEVTEPGTRKRRGGGASQDIADRSDKGTSSVRSLQRGVAGRSVGWTLRSAQR